MHIMLNGREGSFFRAEAFILIKKKKKKVQRIFFLCVKGSVYVCYWLSLSASVAFLVLSGGFKHLTFKPPWQSGSAQFCLQEPRPQALLCDN